MAHENRRFEARFEAMEKRMDGIDMRLAAWIRPMDPTIGSMQAEGNNIRRGLQVFFRYFGRHEEAIDHLKSKL